MELTLPTTPKRHRQAAELPLTPPVTPQKGSMSIIVHQDVLEKYARQSSSRPQAHLPSEDPIKLEEIHTDSDDSEATTEYPSDEEIFDYAGDAKDLAAHFGISNNVPVPVPYITTCPNFPAGAPINFPHLINPDAGFTEEDFPSGIRLPDGVATLLHYWNPHAAQMFMDLSTENVELIRTDQSEFYCDLVVARKGSEVRVGYYNLIPADIDGEQFTLYEWDTQVRARIQPSGMWLLDFASHCGLSDGIFGCYENDEYGYYQHSPVQQSRVYEIARQLATCLVVRKPWIKGPGVDIKMSIS